MVLFSVKLAIAVEIEHQEPPLTFDAFRVGTRGDKFFKRQQAVAVTIGRLEFARELPRQPFSIASTGLLVRGKGSHRRQQQARDGEAKFKMQNAKCKSQNGQARSARLLSDLFVLHRCLPNVGALVGQDHDKARAGTLML
ncbi:MAG: hypothetical protein ACREHD_26700, partial [Pirellulales bacterium]